MKLNKQLFSIAKTLSLAQLIFDNAYHEIL